MDDKDREAERLRAEQAAAGRGEGAADGDGAEAGSVKDRRRPARPDRRKAFRLGGRREGEG